MNNSTFVLKMKVSDISHKDLIGKISNGDFKKGAYICVSNVHMCMEGYDNSMFMDTVNNADIVIADGKPIALATKLLGANNTEQIRGFDITNSICELSNSRDIRIGLYGGTSASLLERVKSNLKAKFPNINIVYSFSPPFRPLTDKESLTVVNDINENKVDILFVGLGCPKQEIWMQNYKDKLNCLMLGIGAVFDFISGEKKHAPKWLQFIGCEWLFRLCCEPRRLWKRYLKHNPRFIILFLRQLLFCKQAR